MMLSAVQKDSNWIELIGLDWIGLDWTGFVMVCVCHATKYYEKNTMCYIKWKNL